MWPLTVSRQFCRLQGLQHWDTLGQAQKYKEYVEEGTNNLNRKTYLPFLINSDVILKNVPIKNLSIVPLGRQITQGPLKRLKIMDFA